MIPLPGEVSYRCLAGEQGLGLLHEKMAAQDLFWAAWPQLDDTDRASFVKYVDRPEVLALGGFIKDELAGCLTLQPFGDRTLVAEIGVTAFRPYFSVARPLFLHALGHALNILEPAPTAFVGRVARVNRHIIAMLASCGFTEMGRIPGLVWHSRKRIFMEGALVMATSENILKLLEA